MSHKVELLWFEGCVNHPSVRQMLEEVIAEVAPGVQVFDVDATDPTVAKRVRFPGSPAVRVDGRDVDPSHIDPATTPRAVACIEPVQVYAVCRSACGSSMLWRGVANSEKWEQRDTAAR